MAHLIPVFIDSYQQAAVVTACLLILVYLVYNRVRYRQYLFDQRLTARRGPCFSAQVMARLVGQQTERSLAAVVRTIVEERERLQQWVEQSVLPTDTENPSEQTDRPEAPLNRDDREAVGGAGAHNRYAQIPQLAATGKSAAEIAAAIDRPLAEIELSLTLARRRAARAADEKTEKFAPAGKNFRLVPIRRVV